MRAARILVVDDEPGMVRAVERVLGDAHHVVGSSSSAAALGIAADFNPELAIVDIRMPDVDGFELMTRLKARFPDLDIILMTGSIEDLDEKLIRAVRSQAYYFIQKPFDREVLLTLVDRCLELRWRREEHRRHLDRLEGEMNAARAFQQSLLPEPSAIVNGIAICCRYTPCERLGGDLYDYAATSSGRTALLVADVSGHGVSAAMLTGVVKSAFHACRAQEYEPLTVVHRVSAGLAAFGLDRFVTLVAALIAPDECRLHYVSAGHPSMALWNSRGHDPLWLESTGPIVSPAFPAAVWEKRHVPMGEGDRLLLFTDGVLEGLESDDGCGQARIASTIDRHAEGGAPLLDSILAALRCDLAGRPQADDFALLTASVLPNPAAASRSQTVQT
jgi:sigma-B regulation protein RsbU (phosphoserine phosphatase)